MESQNNSEDDSNVLFSDDPILSSGDSGINLLSDSSLSLEDSCLTLHNPSENLSQSSEQTPTSEYWQVPKDSMNINEVLIKHGYKVVKKRYREASDFDNRVFDIYGKKTGKHIGRFVGYRGNDFVLDYDANDLDKTRDCLELKDILNLIQHPIEIGENQDKVVRQLRQEIDERSDLVKRIQGGNRQ